jgi:hypothetical protein
MGAVSLSELVSGLGSLRKYDIFEVVYYFVFV